jgi:glucose-6-phosphate isomerase
VGDRGLLDDAALDREGEHLAHHGQHAVGQHGHAAVVQAIQQGHDVAPVHGVELQAADDGQHLAGQQALIFGP